MVSDSTLGLSLLVGAVAMLAALWRIFSKAGQPGWKALVPIYGAVVFMRIVKRPGWWVLLLVIPLVNIIPSTMLCIDLARVFGKGGGYAAGLMLVPPVFLLMLAFGNAQYRAGADDAEEGSVTRRRAA